MKVIIFLVVLVLTSCNSTRSYQRAQSASSYGFHDKRISSNMFKITYNGTAFGDLQKTIDFCLLRCSEVTLENGFSFFTLPYQKSGMYSHLIKNPDLYGKIGGNPVKVEGAYAYDIPRALARNTIVCYKNNPRKKLTFNANEEIKRIKNKYNM